MAATIIVETGSGTNPLANSYVTEAEADAYFETTLFAATWTGLVSNVKIILLITATRMIDSMFVFNGKQSVNGQPLQWPRYECLNPDAQSAPINLGQLIDFQRFFPAEEIPKLIKEATFEVAKSTQSGDRTGDKQGAGIKSVNIYQGIAVEFSGKDVKPVVSNYVQTMLAKVAFYRQGSGVAKLVRT